MSHTTDARGADEPRRPNEWTVMFYFASDNPLAPGIVSQLKSIKDAGYHPDVNVIARFDPSGTVMPTHVFEVNGPAKRKAGGRSQIGPPEEDPFVRNLVFDRLGENSCGFDECAAPTMEDGGTRSGNGSNPPATRGSSVSVRSLEAEQTPERSLTDFLEFCRQRYPARHYVLFILGHGLVVGNDLFLYDENTFNVTKTTGAGVNESSGGDKASRGLWTKDSQSRPEQALLLSQLRTILTDFKKNIGNEGALELVGFHSCSMSSLEVAYEIRDTARYMLASQGPAFVGTWPYRQILMRMFKSLNAGLMPCDIIDAECLVSELPEEVSRSLTGEQLSPGGAVTRGRGPAARSAKSDLPNLLAKALNDMLDRPQMYKDECFALDELCEARSRIEAWCQEGVQLSPGDTRRFNRGLLAARFPESVAGHATVDTLELFSDIFHYCLYNSLDFRLAGYSFDITLCDLSKVGLLAKPFSELAEALSDGLDSRDKTVCDHILLAHWEAQSFWQENYIDLYDFCLRLYVRCREAAPASETTRNTLRTIKLACYKMMKALSSDSVIGEFEGGDGAEVDADLAGVKIEDGYGEAVVLSRFIGPTYQYSHGFSVFFPWSEPVANPMWEMQYEHYQLNEAMKGEKKGAGRTWKEFLQKYFDTTMRRPTRGDEDIQMRRPLPKYSSAEERLEQVEDVFATSENWQLAQVAADESLDIKPGGSSSLDGTIKPGGSSTVGGGCGCPSLKNYPRTARASRVTTVRALEEGRGRGRGGVRKKMRIKK